LSSHFLNEVNQQLRRRGVSRRYVRRLICELHDHFDALVARHRRDGVEDTEAQRLAERELGDPAALVREVLARQRVGALVRRHPVAVFALSPVPLALMLALACAVIGTVAYLACVRVLHISATDQTLRLVFHHAFYGIAYGLTPLLALAYCRLAARAGCPAWMAGVASVMLCAAGGFLVVHFVQCGTTGSVKYFQWWGISFPRLALPLAAFAAHTAGRALRAWVAGRALLP
jgi:hypothetical protein